MSKEIKQKADELVQMFANIQIYAIKNSYGKLTSPYKSGYLAIKTREYESVKCAILDQKRLIDGCRNHFHYGTDYLEEQKEILTELKNRL